MEREHELKTLVLHDYFEAPEGGGRLSLILARHLNSDLAYGFKTKKHPFFINAEPFSGKELQISSSSMIPIWRQWKLARDFSRAGIASDYKTAIYSGFYAPLAVELRGSKKNIYYCHTPPRFIYDQREYYLSLAPCLGKVLLNAFIRHLQPKYEQAIKQMDVVVANSENVRKRILKYLNIDATVVYPPCDTERFQWQNHQGYYLSCARLDSLKRVDLIIEAFLQMPEKKLVIASTGPEASRLKKKALGASNITFTGQVSEEIMAQLIGQSIATIYIPKDEDFGMSPVESMAAGKPVVGVNEGGIPESVIDGVTGVLLPANPDVGNICHAVRLISPEHAFAMRYSCEKRSLLFKKEIFLRKMAIIIG